MKLRLSLVALLLSTLQQPAPLCASSGAVPAPEPGAILELPFQISHGYLILVEGRIGNRSHLKFLCDTGTSMSIIDSKIADALRLPRQPSGTFNFDRFLNFDRITLPDLHFGPVNATNLPVFTARLADYFEFAHGVDAVIGLDLLSSTNFTVDYQANKILFHAPAREFSSESDPSLPAFLSLDVRVQGHPLRLIIGTGFPTMVLFEGRLRDRAADLQLPGTPSSIIIGKRLYARQLILRDVEVAGTRMNFAVVLAPSPSSDVLPGIVGIMGLSALHARRVNFNFCQHSFSWE